jgi:hypothetical protein
MLKSLRQLFQRGQRPADLSVFQAWAAARGFEFRLARDGSGCIMEGRLGLQSCRIEWGPSQRSYISGPELRLIADVDLPRDLVLLVLNKALQEVMEKTVYEQFVDDVQTRIDTDTPAEMRWLVMFTRAGPQDLGRLRERYGAATNLMPWLTQWLTTPLNDALAATIESVPAEQPVVLTVKAGRLLLRTAMDAPDASALAQWVSVFDHALRESLRLGASWREAAGAGPQTQPYAWSMADAAAAGATDLPLLTEVADMPDFNAPAEHAARAR